VQGIDASIFLQAERTEHSGEKRIVEFAYNRYGGLVWERKQGEKSFNAVEPVAWGSFEMQDPQQKAGMQYFTAKFGNTDYIHIDPSNFNMYQDFIPSFRMVQKLIFRPWVTHRPSKQEAAQNSVNEKNSYRWSGYMRVDNKQMGYYVMVEDWDEEVVPPSRIVLAFDSACRLVGVSAPKDNFFVPVNYIPMVQVVGEGGKMIDVGFNMENTRIPNYHSKIQHVINTHPNADVYMSLNNVSYEFFEHGMDADIDRTSSISVDSSEKLYNTRASNTNPAAVSDEVRKEVLVGEKADSHEGALKNTEFHSIDVQRNKDGNKGGLSKGSKENSIGKGGASVSNEVVNKQEAMVGSSDSKTTGVADRVSVWGSPNHGTETQNNGKPTTSLRTETEEYTYSKQPIFYAPNSMNQSFSYASIRNKFEGPLPWKDIVDLLEGDRKDDMDWIHTSFVAKHAKEVKFTNGKTLYYPPTMPISQSRHSNEGCIGEQIIYTVVPLREEYERYARADDWVRKRAVFNAFMNKLYTLKYAAVFDRFGTEYSLEEVFFAQDKRGRTYLYAEDH
jgi:hypothetical protein